MTEPARQHPAPLQRWLNINIPMSAWLRPTITWIFIFTEYHTRWAYGTIWRFGKIISLHPFGTSADVILGYIPVWKPSQRGLVSTIHPWVFGCVFGGPGQVHCHLCPPRNRDMLWCQPRGVGDRSFGCNASFRIQIIRTPNRVRNAIEEERQNCHDCQMST